MIGFVVFAAVSVVIATLSFLGNDTSALGQLRKARRYRLGELPENTPGRIVGTAQALGEELVAPLSGRRCLFYVVRVDEANEYGRTGAWRSVVREERNAPFVVADGSGRAIVDPTGAQLALDFDHHSLSGPGDDPGEAEYALLARHGEPGQGSIFNRTLRYSEAVIEPGAQVAILGGGVREPDPDAPPADAYRGEQPTRLRLTSSAKHPLVISNLPEALAGPSE